MTGQARAGQGVIRRFSTDANRDTSAADPQADAPQVVGYCAWAVSKGHTARTDPDAWRIVDGKFYLNHSRRSQRK